MRTFEERERMIRQNKQRRTRQLRFRITVSCFAAIILTVVALGTLLMGDVAYADESVQKKYKSVQIHKGETLWSLAEEYGNDNIGINDYIREVCFINHLSEEDILIRGQYLIVPYYE